MARNAQETIRECLESLQPFNEIILYLNDSTDDTEKISTEFKNVKIVKGDFIGFGPTKNIAASYAKNDWIFSLDSDEVINEQLLLEIQNQDYTNENNLFVLQRENYFLGYKKNGKDSIVRIYNRKKSKFNDNAVHEKVIVSKNSKKIVLKNSFKHLNITDINQTLTKMIKYTDLGAKDKKVCFFSIVIFKSLFAFIQSYFLRLYFLHGWVGFTIAISSANRRFYKYLKQFLNCKKIDK